MYLYIKKMFEKKSRYVIYITDGYNEFFDLSIHE